MEGVSLRRLRSLAVRRHGISDFAPRRTRHPKRADDGPLSLLFTVDRAARGPIAPKAFCMDCDCWIRPKHSLDRDLRL